MWFRSGIITIGIADGDFTLGEVSPFLANIAYPRAIEDKLDKAVESIKSGLKGLFGKKK